MKIYLVKLLFWLIIRDTLLALEQWIELPSTTRIGRLGGIHHLTNALSNLFFRMATHINTRHFLPLHDRLKEELYVK